MLLGEPRDKTKCGMINAWHFLIHGATIGKEICKHSAHVTVV